MISEKAQRLKYVLSDYAASNVAWFAYNCIRFARGEVKGGYLTFSDFITSGGVIVGQLLFPLSMMVIYWLSGYYNQIFRKSRLQELITTFWTSTISTLVIFFVALINDLVDDRTYNYEIIGVLFALLFSCVYLPRLIITTACTKQVNSGKINFRTLVVGCGSTAVSFVSKLENMAKKQGYNVVGYVSIPGENDVKTPGKSCYNLDDIENVCNTLNIEELIIAPTIIDSSSLLGIVNRLFLLNKPIKITPDNYSILLSRVHIKDLYGSNLIDIAGSNMTASEQNIKRAIDVVVSLIMMIVLLPVTALVALIIKNDSKGPVFYSQTRIGLHNKPFKIYKFRTMRVDAEMVGTPQLSDDNDPRITKVGRVLRKYRIDELPQFWNVLRGDMSIVGPRPERQYYIDQIVQRMPAYSLLHQVRPGITSMGMVKFGYARNVDEMIERLRFDLIYLENTSLLNDLKIIIYTIKIVLTGKGI